MPKGKPKAKGKNGKNGKPVKAKVQVAADATPGDGATAPATVTATPAQSAPVFKMARKNKATGAVEARKPGRPHPDYEYGYTDAEGTFNLGLPPMKKRKPGRPVGSPSKQAKVDLTVKFGRNGKTESGLGAINVIVAKEVKSRLRSAHAAAINAFSRALGI